MVEYPNDFAFWAANALHDLKLAEKLSSIDPFEYENLTQIREALVELLEEYLWDFPYNPQVLPGFELYFCEASAVVMRSGIAAQTLRQFCAGLQTVGLDSVYYHFIEARRRLGHRNVKMTFLTGLKAISLCRPWSPPFGILTSISTPCRKSGTPSWP